MVNLAVDLHSERFDDGALARALEGIEAAGFAVERVRHGDDAFLAWLDDEFGGTWSSEAYVGSNVIARKDGRCAGFASYDARGLQFSWLRGLATEPGVGIFGPFGVDRAFRKSPIGPHLLVAALASLREVGYDRALVPAVGHEKLIEYYQQHSGAVVVERLDRARWKQRRFRATALVSGNGSNLQAVLDASAAGSIPIDVTAVISNVEAAYALERACKANVATVMALPWDRMHESRETYDRRLLDAVRSTECDLVLLLGWMHLLPRSTVDALPEMLNVHPAFLPLDPARDVVGFPDGTQTPAFRGPRAVRDALVAQAPWVGASVHRVTIETDRGAIMQRKPLRVNAGETEADVLGRLHPIEYRVVLGSIMRWVFER